MKEQSINRLKISLYFFIIIFFLANCKKEKIGDDYSFEHPIDFANIDIHPAWSPDGQWIAFEHGGLGETGIYLISPDGEKVKEWHTGIASTPAWSPDGQWIAFSGNAQIWKKKINGDSLTQLTFEGKNFFPTWSPDGQWIAYDSNLDSESSGYFIWKIRIDGSAKKRIKYTPGEGAWRMPDWGIDFTIICQKFIVGNDNPEIFMMDSTGGNVTRLTYNDAPDDYPKISGNKIAFTSRPKNNLSFQIWTINADGTGLKQLTVTRGYTCDWSPNGKQIVYTDSRAENGRLWIIDADSSNKKQLTFKHNF